LWFAVAISYTYGDFIIEIVQNNTSLHYLIQYTHYLPTISFVLYSGTFVLTIITLQRDSIKFQINQLCWTILVLCLTVGQLKYIMHNIFNGLIWFVLPCCLVFTNDIMAYVSGVSCRRKFIHRPFISFSPNKTWEGFIGGWFFTMIVSWHLSRYLAHYTWMTCPMHEFRLWYRSESLVCDLDPIFVPAQSYIPSQIFELLPISLVKIVFPSIVEICAVRTGTSTITTSTSTINVLLGLEELTPCVSGESTHQHHHFELSLHDYYPIQIHALWLGLFASLVAPFGGFLASAIKRAYRIKDFDSIIPGHGGVMDRTFVYLLSFPSFEISLSPIPYLIEQ
jgi:phosphatidate cytidylyltransferase